MLASVWHSTFKNCQVRGRNHEWVSRGIYFSKGISSQKPGIRKSKQSLETSRVHRQKVISKINPIQSETGNGSNHTKRGRSKVDQAHGWEPDRGQNTPKRQSDNQGSAMQCNPNNALQSPQDTWVLK